MKLEGLKQLVKEELKRVLNENQDLRNSYLEDLTPGKYEIWFTIDRDSGGDEIIINLTQDDLTKAIEQGFKDDTGKTTSFKFWIGLVDDHPLFTSRDKVQYVKKIA
jgi:hypothetical protein